MSSNKKVVKFVGQTATFLTTIREKAKNVYTFIIPLFSYLSSDNIILILLKLYHSLY